jgi:hypothetical protein
MAEFVPALSILRLAIMFYLEIYIINARFWKRVYCEQDNAMDEEFNRAL